MAVEQRLSTPLSFDAVGSFLHRRSRGTEPLVTRTGYGRYQYVFVTRAGWADHGNAVRGQPVRNSPMASALKFVVARP